MTDRGVFGLLGVLGIVALIMFLMTPHEPGSTGERMRQAAQNQIHETADRLGTAFDAARKDFQPRPERKNDISHP